MHAHMMLNEKLCVMQQHLCIHIVVTLQHTTYDKYTTG